MLNKGNQDQSPPRRSDGTRQTLRPVNPWPKGRPFKILSIDGGGILGLLPCKILAELERRFLNGEPIGKHFDLLVGTSTGGIIALGLGQEKSAEHISKLYTERGRSIFPGNRLIRMYNMWVRLRKAPYSRENLEAELQKEFGEETFGSASVATCIPAFEGHYGETFVFKTPHHRDYKMDWSEKLVDIGLSTAAAPTFFPAVERNGYIFADGGIWANNPAMIGVVEALSCFDIERTQIRLLSLGCGQERYRMKSWHRTGGRLIWAFKFYQSAMRAQSQNAVGQAGLLIGKENLIRLDGNEESSGIAMDDVERAIDKLPSVARSLVEASGHGIYEMFLSDDVNDDPNIENLEQVAPVLDRPSTGNTTRRGYVNPNDQMVICRTILRGDSNQWVYHMKCLRCEHNYGANGFDTHHRRCPKCDGGQPGHPYDE